jgi:hypothetical protein
MILNTNNVAISTPVVIEDEFRVSIEGLDMKLLQCPEEHKKLDERLWAFLQLLRGSDDYETCANKGREIIESVAGQQPGSFSLVRPTWESVWKRSGYVETAWFEDTDRATGQRLCGKKIVDALYAVFEELVRFALDATTDHSEQEYLDQLRRALSAYLRLRGFSVKPLSESLSEGEETILEAMNQMKAKNELPARYHEIALVAGYTEDHCRRVLGGLVNRKLILKGRLGYFLQ